MNNKRPENTNHELASPTKLETAGRRSLGKFGHTRFDTVLYREREGAHACDRGWRRGGRGSWVVSSYLLLSSTLPTADDRSRCAPVARPPHADRPVRNPLPLRSESETESFFFLSIFTAPRSSSYYFCTFFHYWKRFRRPFIFDRYGCAQRRKIYRPGSKTDAAAAAVDGGNERCPRGYRTRPPPPADGSGGKNKKTKKKNYLWNRL